MEFMFLMGQFKMYKLKERKIYLAIEIKNTKLMLYYTKNVS